MPPTPEHKTFYEELHRARESFHADPARNPFLKPKSFGSCNKPNCIKAEKLGCRHHDLERILIGSRKYSEAWLKKRRILWHPDKFSGKGEGPVLADAIFKMIQTLIEGPPS